uniref:Cytochrome p450 CYP3049B5 n=1 Tax=Brachionus calyciflorus TaxID=104777 RepID=A0A2H4PSI7_9BILA|nr:cytochrome p450 CYP3049B5 [Brachionus calyciflorus]
MLESKISIAVLLSASILLLIKNTSKTKNDDIEKEDSKLLLNTFKIFLGFVILYLIYITVKIYFLRRKYRHIPGPKTKGIIGFYLGNIPELKSLISHKMAPDIFVEWTKEYGPCFKYQIFDKVSVFTISSEAVKEMYIEKNFPKHPDIYSVLGFPYGSRYMGTSLVSSLDNIAHKKRRTILNPAFSRQALNGFMDVFNVKSDSLMNKLRSLAAGKKVFKILDELNNLTLDVIAAACFGMENDSISKENDLKKLVFESLRGLTRLLINPTIKYNPFEWGNIKKYKQILGDLRTLGKTQIKKRIENMQDGSYVVDDLITLMVKNTKNNEIDIEDLIDDFLTFFVAGQETTSNMLAFAILELGQNPDALEKLRNEIDSVIGSKQEITSDDLTKMKYLSCVLKETLRKWALTPLTNRQSTIPFKIYDYDIPLGSEVQVSSYVSGRQEEFFPNSDKFEPERFSDENKINTYTYFPFSLGPRNCIGQNFSLIEGKICLAKIVQNFDIKLDPKQNFGGVQHATISPADGCRVTLEIRR